MTAPPTAGKLQLTGAQVAIKVAEAGRYLEVGADGWLFASSFSHNKHSARFHVEPVSPEMLSSLVRSREYKEHAELTSRKWDMRPSAQSSWDSPDPDASKQDDDQGDIYVEAASSSASDEPPWQQLTRAAERGATGWVVLRSEYAGGYVEVIGRGEEPQYVVRIGSGGHLSYRSLFLISEEALWSHAVGGYVNWRRPTSSEPQQHMRAHGDLKPFGPLRQLSPTSRMHITTPPPVQDVLGSLACPTAAPPFEWNLLLDAARAGSCDSASLEAVRMAALSLRTLDDELGPAFASELPDLASAYRTILLDEEWSSVLDLQLRPCNESFPEADFSWVDEASGELVVNATSCPRAAFAEVLLPHTADEVMPMEMVRLDAVSANGAITPPDEAPNEATSWRSSTGDVEPAGEVGTPTDASPGASSVPAAPSTYRAPLRTDAAFVRCDYSDASTDTNGYTDADQAPVPDAGPSMGSEGEVEYTEGEKLVPRLQQNLVFRVSKRREWLGPKRTGGELEALSEERMATLRVDGNSSGAPGEPGDAFGAASAPGDDSAREARSDELASRLSVLMLMLDATSRAHLRRMMPSTMALLRALSSSGAVSKYEFPYYSIVGFNSLPNTVPMLAGVDAQLLIKASAASSYGWEGGTSTVKGVWDAFGKRGYATFLMEELHDGCSDLSGEPSSASKLFYSRLGAAGMPHHNSWQIFCQPEMRPCCTDPDSFLRPGRRQCVGQRELPELMLGYVKQLLRVYAGQGTPRMGLLNLNTAHEHFMTRLGAFDQPLRDFFLSIEAHLRRDTALFLLADHGTHGIWYNHFGVGRAEHNAPALTLLLPAGFAKANPAAHEALLRNQRRRVTAYDLHATLQHLASWPVMPRPAVEATSLFVDLPDDRSCETARVPAEWCIEFEPSEDCFPTEEFDDSV